MRVYIAAKYEDWPRVRHARDVLRAAGHEITWDWTANVETHPQSGGGTPDEQLRHAFEDLEGVRKADAVLLLTPDHGQSSIGMWVEFGAALMGGALIILAGQQHSRSIFCRLATHARETDAEAIGLLLELGGQDAA